MFLVSVHFIIMESIHYVHTIRLIINCIRTPKIKIMSRKKSQAILIPNIIFMARNVDQEGN